MASKTISFRLELEEAEHLALLAARAAMTPASLAAAWVRDGLAANPLAPEEVKALKQSIARNAPRLASGGRLIRRRWDSPPSLCLPRRPV